ncbi:MAG TPA: hypothetical protein VHD55_00025 [Candidatus Paceibacterota bacterium]|nr:hypothetical protein [Candidatus Paceibacterota bacterium]
MTQSRTDVDVLLGVPEQIFLEFSERYGQGDAGQKRTSAFGGSDHRLVRPLKESGALLYDHSSYPNFAERHARVELLSKVPSREDLESAGGTNPLLILRVGKRFHREGLRPGQKVYILNASAEFTFSKGFSFVEYERYWPLVREMLDRFHELAAGFSFTFEEVNRAMLAG